jgi:hypothetical protein
MRLFGLAILTFLVAATAHADYTRKYEVTITNVTQGQTFTPQLVAAHGPHVSVFQLGAAAGKALEALAEAGDTSPLTEELLENGYQVSDVHTVPGLLGPGESVTTTLEASPYHRYMSFAAMLIPTNDTFVALNRVALPRRGATHTALGYDAGTEANDQNCLNIPGPRCGGEGHSMGPNDGDEGHIHVSNGFHELPAADFGEVLQPASYDWRNPVARVVVRRLR